MERALLIGNGVNRLSSPDAGWFDLIRTLRERAFKQPSEPQVAELQPLPLVFQACCSKSDEDSEKQWFAEQIRDKLHDIDLHWHQQLMNVPCSDVLTTNYDFNLERSLRQLEEPSIRFASSNTARETVYSLFRRQQAQTGGGKCINVWHIRGDIDTNSSLMLGTSQYAGGLQKLRNFLTQGVNTRDKSANDGVYRSHFAPYYWQGRNSETQSLEPDSWVNAFLSKQLHVIGFGLDFAEHDLWWLIAEKQQLRGRKVLPNRTKYKDTYWSIGTRDQLDNVDHARNELLEAFGWQIERIVKPSYAEGYSELIQRLRDL